MATVLPRRAIRIGVAGRVDAAGGSVTGGERSRSRVARKADAVELLAQPLPSPVGTREYEALAVELTVVVARQRAGARRTLRDVREGGRAGWSGAVGGRAGASTVVSVGTPVGTPVSAAVSAAAVATAAFVRAGTTDRKSADRKDQSRPEESRSVVRDSLHDQMRPGESNCTAIAYLSRIQRNRPAERGAMCHLVPSKGARVARQLSERRPSLMATREPASAA